MKNLQSYDQYLNEAVKHKHKGLIVYVLSIGMVNIQSGKTKYNWSIYDDKNVSIYICGDGTRASFLLYGAKGSLDIGDNITLIGNDTQRKVDKTTIIDICDNDKDTLITLLYDKYKMDYKLKRAFQKATYPWKLRTSFSIKGVELIK